MARGREWVMTAARAAVAVALAVTGAPGAAAQDVGGGIAAHGVSRVAADWPAAPEITAANAPIVATLPDGRRIGVVDGDSLAVDGVEWRLRGMDAPEIERAKCEAERRLALLARSRLAALIAGGRGLVLADSGETDRHRRPLGTLSIDGADAGATLIAEGYARPYNGGPRKGWCTRDSRDDMIPGPRPARDLARKGK